MSGCAVEGCDTPNCPVCRCAGRSAADIQLQIMNALEDFICGCAYMPVHQDVRELVTLAKRLRHQSQRLMHRLHGTLWVSTMTRRDGAIRDALSTLAIAERYCREASAVFAGESYDDRQMAAKLRACTKCGQSHYVSGYAAAPACARCR